MGRIVSVVVLTCDRCHVVCATQIRANMAEVGATAHVLCALDNIAWALNVRGSDIPHNPVAYVAVHARWYLALFSLMFWPFRGSFHGCYRGSVTFCVAHNRFVFSHDRAGPLPLPVFRVCGVLQLRVLVGDPRRLYPVCGCQQGV